LPIPKSTRVPALQIFKNRLGFKAWIDSQILFYLSPKIIKWIFPCPPKMVNSDFVGQFTDRSVLARRLLVHVRLRRR